LYSVFKNRSCQGLSPNPCCDPGHPKNCNHNAIWFVWISFHTFWAVQRRTNFPKNDVPNHRWSGRCVCIHGQLTSWFSEQANTPRHLEAFFSALATIGLAINLEKCIFAVPSLEILRHTIMATRAAPTADHATEIKNCPTPQDIKQLQHFLGMVNFYCRFLPNCAQVLKPLTDLPRGRAKTVQWTATAQEAFQQAKRLLAAAVPLQHPDPNAELSLATDASDTLIGGVMQQIFRDHWWSLGFFSCKLTDTESCYSTFDRKLLAAQAAIKHFHHFCEGSVFQLKTNHKPLVTALSRVSIPISHRQQCHLAFISEFNVQLLCLPGLKNVVADFFSCPSHPHRPPDQSPPQWRQIRWITKRWLPSNTAAWKRNSC
jgi:hypothetical protein